MYDRLRPGMNDRKRKGIRTIAGAFLSLVGSVVLFLTLFRPPHTDHRHAAAWVRWYEHPSPVTEAAWIRERDRVDRQRSAAIASGAVILVGGLWLLLGSRRRRKQRACAEGNA